MPLALPNEFTLAHFLLLHRYTSYCPTLLPRIPHPPKPKRDRAWLQVEPWSVKFSGVRWYTAPRLVHPRLVHSLEHPSLTRNWLLIRCGPTTYITDFWRLTVDFPTLPAKVEAELDFSRCILMMDLRHDHWIIAANKLLVTNSRPLLKLFDGCPTVGTRWTWSLDAYFL